MRVKCTNEKESNVIPDDALEALARCLLPTIRSYFESGEGQREFTEWQARQGIENLPGRDAEFDAKDKLAG